jgi:hypothetical protein
MVLWSTAILSIGLAGAADVVAPKSVATVVGSDISVGYIRQGSVLLLDATAVGEALGWKAAIVMPGKLMTMCREKNGAACIPVRLDGIKTATHQNRLLVDASVLARALRFVVEDTGGQVRLRSTDQKDTSDDIAAYNAAWPKGRGFRTGDTLPDIPLVDMDGQEVRFSRFLGKQYILYCWASW